MRGDHFTLSINTIWLLAASLTDVVSHGGTDWLSTIMPANVEVKARVKNVNDLVDKASKLSASEGCLLRQEDTFFNVPNDSGEVRLKLRETQGAKGQLISYIRTNTKEPKLSEYYMNETADPASLKKTLEFALGIKAVVKKCRRLYMVGITRIHIDQVEGIGDFMELEVVLEAGQTLEEGREIATDLMEKLGIEEENLLTGAYVDMLC